MKKLTCLVMLILLLTSSLIFANNIKIQAQTNIPNLDFNNNGVIDIQDIASLAINYNMKIDDIRWNPIYDLNGDNIIDIFDIVQISKAIETTPVNEATGDKLVSYAYNFIGTQYVWGGTSPTPGFDSPGFMQYVYANFGIQITRTTYTQINQGKTVSKDEMQLGDLIFFGTYADPHHVGMYVGNNCYIHAPKTGDVIKVSSLSGRSDFLCARRILN
ncbi:MAG: C40 family peptidase [Clostridiaceae bacterium]|nr:C40 family peptidase [Clostridiaceae bacterium]